MREDIFFLAYGGVGWSYWDILALPIRIRKEFVERLKKQIEFEKTTVNRK